MRYSELKTIKRLQIQRKQSIIKRKEAINQTTRNIEKGEKSSKMVTFSKAAGMMGKER